MSKCHSSRRTSVLHPEKFVPRKDDSTHPCPMIGTYFKPRLQDRKMEFQRCFLNCAAPTCLVCPEKDFIHESIIESVSDDLVLLRCQLCEMNYPALSKFVPEPWFNAGIIKERLMEIRKALDIYCRDTSRSDLLDLANVLILMDRIDETMEEGGTH